VILIENSAYQVILIKKYQALQLYSKRIYFVLLLLLYSTLLSQQITIENKNNFAVEIAYKNQKVILKGGESKTISDRDIAYLYLQNSNKKNMETHRVPIFLHFKDSLKITIDDFNKPIEFKGKNESLHNIIVNQQHYILYKHIAKYQDILYNKRNTRELINFSELVLRDYFNKINKSFNASLDKDSEIYKRMEKYVINDWLASVYLFLTGGKTLDLRSRELILYYYNKYIKKGIEHYNCEYKVEYNIISDLAKWINQMNINLPKYPIIENTKDDSINQYLPQSCQKYYFINYFNYYDHINSPQKEYYKKILKEKFNN
jgi:hypothetical protein